MTLKSFPNNVVKDVRKTDVQINMVDIYQWIKGKTNDHRPKANV